MEKDGGGPSRCEVDEEETCRRCRKADKDGSTATRQGRRYRRPGEDRDRSIAGALQPTRTRPERDERRLKGEEEGEEMGWLRLASSRHHSPLGLAALSSSLLSFSLSSFSVRSSAARYGCCYPVMSEGPLRDGSSLPR